MDIKSMGTRIRELRDGLGLTQDDVSEKVGITAGFYSHIETGNRKASVETIVNLADFFNVPIDYILRGTTHTERVLDMYLRKIIHKVQGFTEKDKAFVLEFVNSFGKYAK